MHQLRLIDEPAEPCRFPALAATTGYTRGCRCDRCKLGSPAYRLLDLEAECEFDGCSAPRVRYYRSCEEHKPMRAPKHRLLATRGGLSTEACELCGHLHSWYESQLAASFREEIRELHRRVCRGCIRRYRQTITNHRLHTEWAIRLITGQFCELCGKPFGVDNHGRSSAIVDHDHGCCPGGRSCGWCVRGIICSRCNHQLGVYESLDDIGVDRIRAYLLGLDRSRSDPFGALPRARS